MTKTSRFHTNDAAHRDGGECWLSSLPRHLLQRPAAQAQGGALLGRVGRGSPEDAFVSSDKDLRELPTNVTSTASGLGTRRHTGCRRDAECGDPGPWPGYGYHGTPPPRTPRGGKAFSSRINRRGESSLEAPEASKRTDLDIGMRRAVLPAFGNDPEMRCEPLGLPRLITFSGGGATMEMIHTPERTIASFSDSSGHGTTARSGWTAGRSRTWMTTCRALRGTRQREGRATLWS